MKKVIISTYAVWTSYGSMLQALGLQLGLKEMDIYPQTISFVNEENVCAYEYKLSLNPVSVIKNLYSLMNKDKLNSGREKCLSFLRDNLELCRIQSRESLYDNSIEADVYISGSDQVWNPTVCDCQKDFFLDYALVDKKKISYAASMGVLQIPDEKKELFTKLLNSFNTFSVREKSMVPVIGKCIDKEIHTHIDPVFLVGVEQWRVFEREYVIKEPYILVYALYWDKKYNSELRKLKEKTGYKIVSIQNKMRPIFSDEVVLDVGPSEFLWLIDHAEVIVTSSFHGTAFSILFNKKFSAVINPDSPSRIEDLLFTLGIQNMGIETANDNMVIDYEHVNNRIRVEKQKSLEYLKRNIYGE